MSDENINEIITRQDKQAEEIEALQHKLELYEFELESLLHKIPTQKLFDEYFSDKADKKEDPFTIFQRIAKFWLDNPDKAKQISKELNNCNEYLEFKNKQAVYEKIKVTYYKKLYSYWKMVNEDRTSVFSAAYLNLMDDLADRGWFLYYLQTPDIPIEEKTPDEAENMLAIIYGENNCAYIAHLFKDIITVETTNELRKNKANDLCEALKCLMNAAYQSCARTMFAILENEHKNASNLITRSHGFERAKEISKYVQDMGSTYYDKVWSKINKYYGRLNCDTDKMNLSEINRNDLAHGTYKHIATKTDCIKLMLLFATFKEISFYLQNMVDFINDFKKDSITYIIDNLTNTHKRN